MLDPEISLREITAATLRDVTLLSVASEQLPYVATNAQSIAEAYFHPEAWFRGIYAGDTPVGFVMLEDWTDIREAPPIAPICLWRFMIDKNYQGRGYGKRALKLVVSHVRLRTESTGQKVLLTSYVPGDHSPRDFYLNYGFEPTGETDGDEIVIGLQLR